jgi:hypothetical protein
MTIGFVIGNGISRRGVPLEKLKEFGEEWYSHILECGIYERC